MALQKDVDKQIGIIKRGAVEIISEEQLRRRIAGSIKSKQPLIIKAGFDPSSADIHLGHTVLLRKLRHFQQLGHKVVFLIGDATALVGDPSGQSQTRKTLTREEVEKNVKTYEKQVSRILDIKNSKTFKRRRNSEWFSSFTFERFVELGRRYTVARLLERDDFEKRLKENKPISFLELFYPLMQGYDSVKLRADIEIGGTDQKFNMLAGRNLQQSYNQQAQVVITMPILEGLGGTQKMSKSYANYIGINEPAGGMYGKIMSISDEMMKKYYELLTDMDTGSIKEMHPMEAKKKLAWEIVRQYHGVTQAKEAKQEFEKVFQKRQTPTDIQVKKLPAMSLTLNQAFDRTRAEFRSAGIPSRSELYRKLEEGAVYLDGERIREANNPYFRAGKEHLLKIGKRFFIKIDLK